MIYFSSDLHLNHNKDFIYKPRGFNSIEEMNETIIKNFHSIVKPDDELWLLGDIFLGELEAGMSFFHQLPGKIRLVWGNHDTNTRQFEMANSYNVIDVLGYATVLKYNKYHFYLSHFPTLTTNFDDYQKPLKRRILCLSGHTHSKNLFDEICQSYNVAVDAHNCYPVSIETIIQDFEKQKV